MLETYKNAEVLAAAAAHGIEACLASALRTRGRATLVATGGRSPGPVYDRLKSAPLDWARVVITLSDDRLVPEDHPDSNTRLLRERLPGRAHIVPLTDQAALAAMLPFDAVMLGMGEDGHVASLIPGDPGLEDALTTADLTHHAPEGLGSPPLPRTSLTLSALLRSRAIFLLIAGEAKRQVLARAEAGEDLPVGRLIRQTEAPVRVLWAPAHGD
jgi:6-phosphogluconolactonase